MHTVYQDFLQRVERIPAHRLGLSADVYSPDIFELVAALEHAGITCGYFEIFKGTPAALASLRRSAQEMLLPYHAEGLWVTQPDFQTYPFEAELETTIEQLRMLGSRWINHECASKQMAGYSFGTYLPPLFTTSSAEVTAYNIALVQQRLDEAWHSQASLSPLFLLETPPLTYFGFGEIGMAEFFRAVTERTPCGVVLDVGHLWTVYRYTGEWKRRSLVHFLAEFLDVFPMERVVEIHMAGLESLGQQGAPLLTGEPPRWIDAHGAPIPDVLRDMLAQVLDHPGLSHLKGVALEVDTKPVGQIVQEFAQASQQFAAQIAALVTRSHVSGHVSMPGRQNITASSGSEDLAAQNSQLLRQYEHYARVVSGRSVNSLPCLGGAVEGVTFYTQYYLPREILHWGGDVPDMFPEACQLLENAGQSLNDFVLYWFREPRRSDQPYDFFLLKIEWFLQFVHEVLPGAMETAEREAALLRTGYTMASEPAAAV